MSGRSATAVKALRARAGLIKRMIAAVHYRLRPRPIVWDGEAQEDFRAHGRTASIVLVTHNRVRMLRECVASILANTGDVDYELIVWDNASDDGTAGFLDEIAARDSRVRVVQSPTNIGLNGVAAGVRLARGAYIVEMDDDVIHVPRGWLSDMIHAFETVPRAGYLAANVIQDETTNGAKPSADEYREKTYGDVVIEHGPTGGWCTMTSRAVVARIGNFMELPGRIFFTEDGEFGGRCAGNLYRVGIVRDVRVYHAAGVAKNAEYGCLEACRTKYADDAEFRPLLEMTLDAIERERSGERPA